MWPTASLKTPARLPPASVIVPVKGDDEGLRENLAALASLDYPDYELIVAARSAADIPPGVLPSRVKIVLAHGKDSHTGEKIQNLQAAVRATRKRTRFSPSPIPMAVYPAGWLRALAAPLEEPGVGASTGLSLVHAGTAGILDACCAAFGMRCATAYSAPATARSRGAAPRPSVRKRSSKRASRSIGRMPSATITRCRAAIHAAGLRIAYAPGALVPCFERAGRARPVRLDAPPADDHARLQSAAVVAGAGGPHLLLRRHGGLGDRIHKGLPAGRMGADRAAFAGHAKGLNRATLAKAALPEREPWFRRHAWVHAIWVPLATWLWLVGLLASACRQYHRMARLPLRNSA